MTHRRSQIQRRRAKARRRTVARYFANSNLCSLWALPIGKSSALNERASGNGAVRVGGAARRVSEWATTTKVNAENGGLSVGAVSRIPEGCDINLVELPDQAARGPSCSVERALSTVCATGRFGTVIQRMR
jgi:hypothetical protein